MQSARELAAEIAACAAETEARCELPRRLAERIADAGFFRLLVPRSLAGGELDQPTYVRVIEELAKADASTAWCVNQCAVFATNAAFLPPDVARTIWADPRAAVANGPSPSAQAIPVEGGFRVTGRWAFSSGIHHATWLAGLCFIVEDGERRRLDDGEFAMRHMLFPKEEARIIEHWDVAGLRGTGSHHFAVEDLFVPTERTVFTYRDEPREAGPLYLYPMILLFAAGFASVAIGIARAALDALYEIAATRRPRGMQVSREQSIVQLQVGKAEATLRAARAYLLGTVDEVWDDVVDTGELGLENRVRLRLAATHTIRSAAHTVDSAYDVFGADGIYASSPIQRRFQDMHVVTQHIQARLAHYESAGRFFLGLEPDKRWL